MREVHSSFISTSVTQDKCHPKWGGALSGITGGFRLSRIFWEHENLSGLIIIRLIQYYNKFNNTKKFGNKIRAKRESGLTTVRLKRDPPVSLISLFLLLICTNRCEL